MSAATHCPCALLASVKAPGIVGGQELPPPPGGGLIRLAEGTAVPQFMTRHDMMSAGLRGALRGLGGALAHVLPLALPPRGRGAFFLNASACTGRCCDSRSTLHPHWIVGHAGVALFDTSGGVQKSGVNIAIIVRRVA